MDNMRHESAASAKSTQQSTESERQYRAIFETSGDGLVINTFDGRVLEVNSALCRMHGFSPDELIGAQPNLFIAPESHGLMGDFLAAAREGKSFQTQALGRRKNGSTFPVEVHGAAFTFAGQPAVLAVVRDISARKQEYDLLEQRVADRTRELASLLEVARNVSSTLELTPLLGTILDQLKFLVDYDGAGILALDGDAFTVMGYRGPLPLEQALTLRFQLSEELGHWHVVTSKEPLLIADTWAHWEQMRADGADPDGSIKTRFDYIRSWMLVPLIYKDRVIGALSVEHGEPNHYTSRHLVLANAIASQVAVAMENARLYGQAQRVAVLEERARLARELHDSVSQGIYGLSLYAETASRLLAAGDTHSVRDFLREMRVTAQEALREMRLLVFELRPPKLEELGLAGALRARLEAVEGRTRDLSVRFMADGYERLAPDVEETLYRVAQEALNNVVKHAQATTVAVTIQQDISRTVLDITDDGVGFDPAMVPEGRLGLAGMRERIAQASATLTVASAPGQGTRIWVEVPR